MKKHTIFKILSIMLLLIVVVSYFIPGRNDTISYLALGDVVLNGIQSFYYFFDTAMFILFVGGFYGVLNNTDAYKKLLNAIAKKVDKKRFVLVVTILFAFVTSLTGMTLPLLVFAPFFISIILLMGYDKIVAMSATIGSIIVGSIGGLFLTFRDPSNAYSVSYTTFEEYVGMSNKFGNIYLKLLLCVLALLLLIFHICKYMKKSLKSSKEDREDIFLVDDSSKKETKKVRVWPIVTVLSILFVLMVLGLTPWNSLFGIEIFDNFHTWLVETLTIKDFSIWNNIISANFTAFGRWSSLGGYMITMVVMLVMILIIKFSCKIKFDDVISGFADGMKKMVPSVGLVVIALSVLVCTYNNGFMTTLINNAGDTFGEANIAVQGILTMLGSLLHIDMYYTVAGVFSNILAVVSDAALLPVLAIMFQSFYGLVMLIGPTSILLIVGLTYLDIPYGKWVRYIWRLVFKLFILIFVVLLVVYFI